MTVAAARGKVEILVVEENPGFGRLAGRFAFLRHLLDEAIDGGRGTVDRLVELTIDFQRTVEANSAERDTALLILRSNGRRYGTVLALGEGDGGKEKGEARENRRPETQPETVGHRR